MKDLQNFMESYNKVIQKKQSKNNSMHEKRIYVDDITSSYQQMKLDEGVLDTIKSVLSSIGRFFSKIMTAISNSVATGDKPRSDAFNEHLKNTAEPNSKTHDVVDAILVLRQQKINKFLVGDTIPKYKKQLSDIISINSLKYSSFPTEHVTPKIEKIISTNAKFNKLMNVLTLDLKTFDISDTVFTVSDITDALKQTMENSSPKLFEQALYPLMTGILKLNLDNNKEQTNALLLLFLLTEMFVIEYNNTYMKDTLLQTIISNSASYSSSSIINSPDMKSYPTKLYVSCDETLKKLSTGDIYKDIFDDKVKSQLELFTLDSGTGKYEKNKVTDDAINAAKAYNTISDADEKQAATANAYIICTTIHNIIFAENTVLNQLYTVCDNIQDQFNKKLKKSNLVQITDVDIKDIKTKYKWNDKKDGYKANHHKTT